MDWEQCVELLVKKLLNAAAIWFPCIGEGQRPKGDTSGLCIAGDARSPDGRPDVSKYITGLGPPEETPGSYTSGTHPIKSTHKNKGSSA